MFIKSCVLENFSVEFSFKTLSFFTVKNSFENLFLVAVKKKGYLLSQPLLPNCRTIVVNYDSKGKKIILGQRKAQRVL